MLADGGADGLDVAREVAITVREQFFPALCELEILTRFADSRGIVRAPLESDAHWVERVRFAYIWWYGGGRASSLSEQLRVGFDFRSVTVINHNETLLLYDETTNAALHDETTLEPINNGTSDHWAEFSVIAKLKGLESGYTREQIVWAINEIKPARSKLFEFILIAPLFDETTGAPLFDEMAFAGLTN
jgi:hypothetical protein